VNKEELQKQSQMLEHYLRGLAPSKPEETKQEIHPLVANFAGVNPPQPPQ
jgi:hypothetical protein